MTPFSPDSQATRTFVDGIDGPTGRVSFSPSLRHQKVGEGWATWSNGYTGDVYATDWGQTVATIELPAGTTAFYLYAEPDPFDTIDVSATAHDGTTSGDIPVNGLGGARYFGFYTSGSTTLAEITVTSSTDFAVGEFGISDDAAVAGPPAQVLFLHGVTQSANDETSFGDLRGALVSRFGRDLVTPFTYYQDTAGGSGAGCDPTTEGQQTPPRPDPAVGLPFDDSQNGPLCDSEGDLGQNAARLDSVIQRLYSQNHAPVILIGYSMGGATIRSFLSYSAHLGDGVADHMVDSVVLLHGVEQGSWLANGGPLLTAIPYAGTKIADLIGQAFPNPNRVAVKQFAPINSYIQWVDRNSDRLPDIPTYNTWGDERISLRSCVLFSWVCLSHDAQDWGDVVLMPGSPNPTDTPLLGGERFLPGGYTQTNWEWAETHRIYWDPILDPFQAAALYELYKAPEQHMNYTTTQPQLTVKDCQTGQDINEVDELVRVVGARMQGTTYACSPPAAPTGPFPQPQPGAPPVP